MQEVTGGSDSYAVASFYTFYNWSYGAMRDDAAAGSTRCCVRTRSLP